MKTGLKRENMAAKNRTQDVLNDEDCLFSSLLLSKNVLNGLEKVGFKNPSPVQLKSIPFGRCGLDMIVQAKSGTGKTCVFAVIALEMINTTALETQVIVLAPTREIAAQIHDFLCEIGSCTDNLHCHIFIGGTAIEDDKKKISKCQIAIGTPGRIKFLIESGHLVTQSVRLFVLDEADKLLEPGSFQEQINWIYSTLPKNKQILALSATYPEYLAKHLENYMNEPIHIRLDIEKPALLGIKQMYGTVSSHHLPHVVFQRKAKKLTQFLKKFPFQQCMVFSNYQARAQMLADMLSSEGWPASCISGNQSQIERFNAMKKLKDFKCRVLISTDLTSRGIDCDKVDLVVNLDMPWDTETYLHRVGRAGRFGNYGLAVSFVAKGKEEDKLHCISREINYTIEEIKDFERVKDISSDFSACGSVNDAHSNADPTDIGLQDRMEEGLDIIQSPADYQPVSDVCLDKSCTTNDFLNQHDLSDRKIALCDQRKESYPETIRSDSREAERVFQGEEEHDLLDIASYVSVGCDETSKDGTNTKISNDSLPDEVVQDLSDGPTDLSLPAIGRHNVVGESFHRVSNLELSHSVCCPDPEPPSEIVYNPLFLDTENSVDCSSLKQSFENVPTCVREGKNDCSKGFGHVTSKDKHEYKASKHEMIGREVVMNAGSKDRLNCTFFIPENRCFERSLSDNGISSNMNGNSRKCFADAKVVVNRDWGESVLYDGKRDGGRMGEEDKSNLNDNLSIEKDCGYSTENCSGNFNTNSYHLSSDSKSILSDSYEIGQDHQTNVDIDCSSTTRMSELMMSELVTSPLMKSQVVMSEDKLAKPSNEPIVSDSVIAAVDENSGNLKQSGDCLKKHEKSAYSDLPKISTSVDRVEGLLGNLVSNSLIEAGTIKLRQYYISLGVLSGAEETGVSFGDRTQDEKTQCKLGKDNANIAGLGSVINPASTQTKAEDGSTDESFAKSEFGLHEFQKGVSKSERTSSESGKNFGLIAEVESYSAEVGSAKHLEESLGSLTEFSESEISSGMIHENNELKLGLAESESCLHESDVVYESIKSSSSESISDSMEKFPVPTNFLCLGRTKISEGKLQRNYHSNNVMPTDFVEKQFNKIDRYCKSKRYCIKENEFNQSQCLDIATYCEQCMYEKEVRTNMRYTDNNKKHAIEPRDLHEKSRGNASYFGSCVGADLFNTGRNDSISKYRHERFYKAWHDAYHSQVAFINFYSRLYRQNKV